MDKLNKLLVKYSSPMNILFTFILFILNFSVFRILTPQFKKMTGGYDIPDITLVFSSMSAYELFTQFGEQGRYYYNYIQIADFFYPLVYCIFFALLITGTLGKIFKSGFLQHLNLLPFITALLDYGENISMFIMNRIYPADFDFIAGVAYVFSLGKWIFFSAMLLFALSSVIIFLIYKKTGRLISE